MPNPHLKPPGKARSIAQKAAFGSAADARVRECEKQSTRGTARVGWAGMMVTRQSQAAQPSASQGGFPDRETGVDVGTADRERSCLPWECDAACEYEIRAPRAHV